MSDPKFKPGDRVKWTSQSGGYRSTKHGVVLGFNPAGEAILKYADGITAKSRVKVQRYTYTSSVDRYAVRCESPSGLPVLYAPLAHKVEADHDQD